MELRAESEDQTKLQQFRSVTIAHPHLIALKERLMEVLSDGPRNSVVLVLGPTGVGKSTLRAKVDRELRSSLAGELQADRGRVPVLSMEAEAPDTGIFNWRDHFKRLLEAAREPLIDYKLDRNGRRRRTPAFPFECGPRASGSEYQYSVEQAIRFRRPQAVLIDEAQHLTKMSSGRRLIDQLDVIKSIANHTATPHVLFGTYDLMAFRNLNGQLSRRSFSSHFSRYHADRPQEAAIFINVIRSFSGHLPLKAAADLTDDWEFLYERSIGCVGILKDWLVQALSLMIRRGRRHLERRELEATALTVSQCEKILSECIEGEMRLEESEERHLHLRVRMGLQTAGPEIIANRANPTTMQMQTRAGRNRRPGQRRAVRDPIGLEAAICGT
jgi:energy-coupling factor transporter ATP-binding protein EcfA2